MSATAVLARHSKSFFLASRLLPAACRDEAALLYAWCRRADDAIDLAPTPAEAREALKGLHAELDGIVAGRGVEDPFVQGFVAVMERRGIPEQYPRELLDGMGMDVAGTRYATLDELLLYCFRVAGTVGLMMCHVMGVSDPRALRRACHLGIAMQLTNICRDVLEDWERGRLYLPASLLTEAGAGEVATLSPGGPFPVQARDGVARVVARLLDVADRYYASGDVGLGALSWRCALAIRAARLIYSRIGTVLRARGCDALSGRAVVPGAHKLALAARALAFALFVWPSAVWRPGPPSTPGQLPIHELIAL